MQRNPSTKTANQNTSISATKSGPGRRHLYGSKHRIDSLGFDVNGLPRYHSGSKLARKAAAGLVARKHHGLCPRMKSRHQLA